MEETTDGFRIAEMGCHWVESLYFIRGLSKLLAAFRCVTRSYSSLMKFISSRATSTLLQIKYCVQAAPRCLNKQSMIDSFRASFDQLAHQESL